MLETPGAGLSASLVGREPERVTIERMLAGAVEARGAALVLRGEAGIGKSALLELALRPAAAMTVLQVTGVEAESDLAFAGLFGLLRPILGLAGELPAVQAVALEGALGLAPSADPDRFLVSAAALGLIAAAAEHQPVVCVVDDAHWLDTPSAEALVFGARRLRGERVAMLFAARDGDRRQFEAQGLAQMDVAGLPAETAERLLAQHAPRAAPAVRARLMAEAHGNPLGLIELPMALNQDQLAGRAPLPESIPLTPRLAGLFRRRVDRLPAGAQEALLVAAIDGTGQLAVVLGALGELGLDSNALGPAEQAALLRTDTASLEFRHPLVRAAVYERATLGERQRVHGALATALSDEEHVDRRVWHQAMATVAGDEEVAVALETSARRAQLRAGHASAATAYERAAELTGERIRVAPRLAAAAQAAWDAGQPQRALDLIARAVPLGDRQLRPRLLHLRGVIEARCGSARDALATLLDGAGDADADLALAMLHEAAEAAGVIGNVAMVREVGMRAAELVPNSRRAQFSQRILVGASALVAGELERARATLDGALALAASLGEDPRAQVWAAQAAGGRPDAALAYTTKAVELARAQGLLSLLPVTLEHHARELLRAGRIDLAYVAAQEGYALSTELGHGSGWHLQTMAYVEAIRGLEDASRAHTEEALAIAQRSGDIYLDAGVRAARGLLELTLGRPEAAATTLLEVASGDRHDLTLVATAAPAADAIEAIVRGGLPAERARAPLALVRDWAQHAPSDANRSRLARCEALIGAGSVEERFAQAVVLGDGLTAFERARTHLVYGEWLRRRRRRIDARTHLREAAERFRSIGAAPWAQRAEGELRATGETARRREPSTLDQLTPQELQIAGLAASGLSNPEIASQLFLSPRTIEYHLRKVFTKLGLASRTELIRLEDLSTAAD